MNSILKKKKVFLTNHFLHKFELINTVHSSLSMKFSCHSGHCLMDASVYQYLPQNMGPMTEYSIPDMILFEEIEA